MTLLPVRERLRAAGRHGYLHPFHYQKNTSTSVTLGFEGFVPPQVGNAHQQSECENSLSFPNMMAVANLNLFVRPQ